MTCNETVHAVLWLVLRPQNSNSSVVVTIYDDIYIQKIETDICERTCTCVCLCLCICLCICLFSVILKVV